MVKLLIEKKKLAQVLVFINLFCWWIALLAQLTEVLTANQALVSNATR